MRFGMHRSRGFVVGFVVMTGLLSMVPPAPVYAARVAAMVVQTSADPNDPVRWNPVPQGTDVFTAAELNSSRASIYAGAQADKVVANPNDQTATGVIVAFTCSDNTATPQTGDYTCVTAQTSGQILGTSTPGNYRIAVVFELKRTDGSFAGRAVSALCNFTFPAPGDGRHSPIPGNVRIAKS